MREDVTYEYSDSGIILAFLPGLVFPEKFHLFDRDHQS